LGFGGDSAIKLFSAITVLWRFRSKSDSADAEKLAARVVGGFLFIVAASTSLVQDCLSSDIVNPSQASPGRWSRASHHVVPDRVRKGKIPASDRGEPQFGRALAQLGVTYIPANSPQAKGRIERLWGTFQDRLTSELRLLGATDLATANEVLRRFLPDYNRRFGHAPRETQKAWRAAPKDLSRICCFVHERIVSNDNVVQWDGRRFQIPPQPKRFSFAGAKVQLYQSLRGTIEIYYGDSKLHHAD
jgi:hypothetical protein